MVLRRTLTARTEAAALASRLRAALSCRWPLWLGGLLITGGIIGALGGNALADSDDPEALQAARAALATGDVASARAAYRQIKDGPGWASRFVDAIRWNLLSAHSNDAWRLCELARRTGLNLPDLAYYRVLSEAKASVCTLRMPVENVAWRLLLEAFLYRYPSRFQPRPYRASPYAEAGYGPLVQHLNDEQTHYLAEIATASLLPGTGCRFFSGRFEDRPTAVRYEFAALRSWYVLTHPPQRKQKSPAPAPDAAAPGEGAAAGELLLPGHRDVELRLLTLAEAQKDKDLAAQLLAPFAALSAADWLQLPSPERRFVWQKLINAKLFPAPPYPDGGAKTTLVQEIVAGLKTPEAGEWMGLLAFTQLKPAEQEALVEHLLSLPEVPEKPFLLAQKMHAAYRHGDMPGALAIIRRLLILDEAEEDQAVRNDAALLAAQVFTEYRFDASMLGAVQNTLPSADWGRIFRRQLMVHALTGNVAGYELLLKTAQSTQQGRALRLDADELTLLGALTGRRSLAFQKQLHALNREARLSGRTLTFFADLGGEVLQLTAAEKASVQEYLQAVAGLLTSVATRGGQGQQKMSELIRLYSGQKLDAYGAGGETVREGTVQVGVADLSRAEVVPYPFSWEPPANLPLRELIVQPKTATGRDWEIR